MTNLDVTASIRYLVPTGEKPIYIASTGGADAAINIGAEFEDRQVKVHDARRMQPPARLDQQGFALVELAPGVDLAYLQARTAACIRDGRETRDGSG